jgi:uncharacterized membrane protein HdeD (DUF308 family)
MHKVVHRFQDRAWKHALLGAILFLIAYGLASLAINSGRLTAYFFSIVFFVLGVRQLITAVKKGYAR